MRMFVGCRASLAGLALVAAVSGGAAADPLPQERTSGLPTGKYLFVMREGSSADVSSQAASAAVAEGARLTRVLRGAINGFSVETSRDGAAKIASTTPGIAFYEEDVTVSIYDSFTPLGTPVTQPADAPQVIPWGITRVGACIQGTCGMPAKIGTPWR